MDKSFHGLTSALTGRAVPPKYSYLPTTFLAPRACGPVQRLVRDRLATPRDHHPCVISQTPALHCGSAEGEGGHFAVNDCSVHCLLCGRWPPPKHIFDSQDLTSALTGRAVLPKYSYLPTTFLAPRACGPVQRLVRADLPH